MSAASSWAPDAFARSGELHKTGLEAARDSATAMAAADLAALLTTAARSLAHSDRLLRSFLRHGAFSLRLQ